MGIILEKVADLVYSELLTLRVIEDDVDLKGIFAETSGLTFNVLYQLSKTNTLKTNDKEVLFSLFENIICKKKSLVDKYNKFYGKEIIEEGEYIEPELIEPVIVSVVKVIKPKKDNELPRRFGHNKIMIEIEKQGGKATNAQLTAIELNSLKNLYSNLDARLVKAMLSDDKSLNDEDYRDIRSAISIFRNKVKHILKKK